MIKEQRANEWKLLAQTYARTPDGGSKTGRIVFVFLWASLLGMGGMGIAAAYFVLGPAELQESLIPGLALTILFGVVVPLAVFIVWTHKSRSARQDAFAKSVQDRQGKMLDGLQLADWLTHHWDDAYPQESFMASPKVCRAVLSIDGAPVLVDHTPDGYPMSMHQPTLWWARVVVPAGPYTRTRVNPEHPDVARISELGYAITLGAGGLMATGTPKLSSAPGKNLIGIFEVLPELVKLTRMIDAHSTNSQGIPLTLA